MDLGLAGRTAVVSGASRGIGRACAVALLAEGARVFALGRDEKLLTSLASESDGRVQWASADLSTDAGCEGAAAAALAAFGQIDVLVNCAGAAGLGNVLELSREEIDDALRLKFHGYLRMAQLLAPGMKRRGWGRIVNVAGSAGSSPTADNLPTSLANIAVHNATRALSDELAPFGVTVNVVAPGLTLTDRALDMFAARAATEGRDPAELVAAAAAALPARRAAQASEIASAVCFLASDAASYVFGSALYLDGGARRATP